MATMLRFDVYGRCFALERRDGGWFAWAEGNDGKRMPAGVAVPGFLGEDELLSYLGDLFHESAKPGRSDVTRLPG